MTPEPPNPRPARSERLVTQPRRQFTPASLAELPRAQRRKLCQVLLTDSGERVIEFQQPTSYDELVLEVTPLWQPGTVRVRIAARPVTQVDVDRLAERVVEAGDAEGTLLAPLGVSGAVVVPQRITLVEPEELITRLERSALIAWPDRSPTPAYDRMSALRSLETDAALVDPVGLRWLPYLALNELPPELDGRGVPPQDFLERVAFRLLTSVFRFGGQRHGEAARGQRLPDSVITWPEGASDRLAAIVDCKASADGYTMAPDHLLRFQRYFQQAQQPLAEDEYQLRYLIVLSSDFTGRADARHPYHGRARELHESVNADLVYLRAVDLARLAAGVEAQELDPGVRVQLDWQTAFNNGLVTAEHLDAMLSPGD